MKTKFLAAVASFASLALAAPIHAQRTDQDVRQLKSNDTINPALGKAYFFYDTVEGKFDIFFLRSLTSAELEQFGLSRAQALAEERAKLRARRDGAPGINDEDLLPDEAFSYVDPDIRNLVRLDSGRVYEKDGKRRTYVVEVPPGEYTIFAAGIDGFTSGTCMCMGTVQFGTEAGQITDLGTILVAPEDGDTDIAELATFEAPEYIRRKALPYIMTIRPASEGDVPPALFADRETVLAEYNAAGPIPNYLGMLVNRMAPIDGVLAYDGDRAIDLRVGSETVDESSMVKTLQAAEENMAPATGLLEETSDQGEVISEPAE